MLGLPHSPQCSLTGFHPDTSVTPGHSVSLTGRTVTTLHYITLHTIQNIFMYISLSQLILGPLKNVAPIIT